MLQPDYLFYVVILMMKLGDILQSIFDTIFILCMVAGAIGAIWALFA